MLNGRLGEVEAGSSMVRQVPDPERGPGDEATLALVTRPRRDPVGKPVRAVRSPRSPRRLPEYRRRADG
jgi:hypothetical protein